MNRKKFWILFVFLVVGVLLSIPSCKDKYATLNINYRYDYFPLDSGHYVDYVVDSITYNYNGDYIRDTVVYLMREMIGDTFYDNTGALNYYIELYRRPDSTYGWSFWKQWFVRRDSSYAPRLLLTEDDIKFVKLVFPPQTGEPWNGNEYVPQTAPYAVYEGWNYFYQSANTPMTINGQNFNNVAVVSEVADSTLIQKTLRTEYYAEGVGMIFQQWQYLTKQNIQADWITGAENGFSITMYITDYNP